jgi:cell wall-associated NlpC family hydrolase
VLNGTDGSVDEHPMPSRPPTPRGRRAAVIVVLLALAAVTVPLRAGADPTPGAPPTPEQLEVASERYNLARLEVERASKLIEDTERRIQLAETRVATARDRIRLRAAALYRRSTGGTPLPITDFGASSDAIRHRAYLEAAERPDEELAEQLDTELSTLRAEERNQRAARAMRQRDADEAARMKRRLDAMAAQALAAQRAAAAARAAGATTTTVPARSSTSVATAPPAPTRPSTGTPSRAPSPSPAPPPPPTSAPPASSRAAIAIAYARAQLGKPYVFAAAGPDTFDCSGLTMAAWAAAGVRMPHYSGSQATMFPKVSWEQLQPGDIVVFYDDLHHVGLYIGDGMMIHAPQTGDVVKIAPAWRTTFQWGVRPG